MSKPSDAKKQQRSELQLWQSNVARHLGTLASCADSSDRLREMIDEVMAWLEEESIPSAFVAVRVEPGKSMRLLYEALAEVRSRVPDDAWSEMKAEIGLGAGELWAAAREGGPQVRDGDDSF